MTSDTNHPFRTGFQQGDRVEMTDEAKSIFPDDCHTGIITGLARDPAFIQVGAKVWPVLYWQHQTGESNSGQK